MRFWSFVPVLLVASVAVAQQTTDNGTATLQARVSGFVDVAAGGPVTLTGTSGGSVTGNKNKGDRITGLTIDLGDLSPVNTNNFVRVTIPLRLRSNVGYTLTVSSPGFSNADPLAIQAADVGFGIGTILRTDQGVNAAGTDTPAAGVSGDPSLDPDFDPATPRWDFAPAKSLGTYSTARPILTGQRIMNVVPASNIGGLTLNTYLVVKPQFFTPGTFTTSVTYTISTP